MVLVWQFRGWEDCTSRTIIVLLDLFVSCMAPFVASVARNMELGLVRWV